MSESSSRAFTPISNLRPPPDAEVERLLPGFAPLTNTTAVGIAMYLGALISLGVFCLNLSHSHPALAPFISGVASLSGYLHGLILGGFLPRRGWLWQIGSGLACMTILAAVVGFILQVLS